MARPGMAAMMYELESVLWIENSGAKMKVIRYKDYTMGLDGSSYRLGCLPASC